MYSDGSLFDLIPCNTTDLNLPNNNFQTSNLPFVISEILLAFFISFGNILVILAVYKFRELRTTTNVFVVSLSIADLLVGLVALPLHILLLLFPSLMAYFTICLLRYNISVVSSGSSGFTLMLIAIDRYIAIHKPYRYSSHLSMSRSIFLCVLTGSVFLVYGSLPLLGWNTWKPCQRCDFKLVLPSPYIMVYPCQTFIVLVVVAVIYGKVFMTANNKAKSIHNQAVSLNTGDGRLQRREHRLFVQNTKAAKTLGSVVGLFAFCVVPFIIFIVWETSTSNKSTLMSPLVNGFRTSLMILYFLNSGINPIIYHKRLPHFRKSFRKLLRMKSSEVETQSH